MSDSKQIADHNDALDHYFSEMLEETASSQIEIIAPKVETQIISGKAKRTKEHDQNKPFQVLLFDVNGLQLAIRSKDIKAILPWPEAALKPRSATSDNEAIIGIYNQIKIINTAYIVLPPQHRQQLALPSFIIMVGDDDWALSCHHINAVITLSPEEIRWRKSIGVRPWLAGTSIEKNCSIINLSGLVDSLSSQILA